MNKSSYFFHQWVFGQLISLIDTHTISSIAQKHQSDYYVKKLDSSDHMISTLFSSFSHCTSLLEIAASMFGLKGEMNHFSIEKHSIYEHIELRKQTA